MSKAYWIASLALSLLLLLTACGQTAAPAPIPTVSLDSSPQNAAPSATVVASAVVAPISQVELSFPLTGMVKIVGVQVGDTVTAGQSLATLDTVILLAKVAEAEAHVVTAETQVRYLRRVGTGQEHLDSAIADVDRTKAALDQAKAMLAQATLVAPISGTVVSVDIAPGETAVPGQIAIVIGNLTHMRIETTDLSERDVPAVQIGQPANVFIEALLGNYTGQVVDIARQSSTVGGDVVYEVIIELDEQPQGLRWGMSAEVEIQTEQ